MFKLSNSPLKIIWPVTIEVPVDGAKEPQKFEVTLTYELPVNMAAGSAERKKTLEQIIVGWSEVYDDDGNALPFNAENLAAFLANHYANQAAARGLSELYSGAYARKN